MHDKYLGGVCFTFAFGLIFISTFLYYGRGYGFCLLLAGEFDTYGWRALSTGSYLHIAAFLITRLEKAF